MDIDAERLRTAEIVTQQPDRGARRRRDGSRRRPTAAPRSTAPTTWSRRFQVGGYKPSDRDRLRDPEALRAAPDDRRHARHRRDHARPADDPGAARRLPRPRGALARTRCCSTTSTRWRCCAGRSPRPRRSAPSACATRCRARPQQLAARPRPRRTSTTSWPASTTWRSSSSSSTRARTSTRACARSTPPDWNRVRYELFKHFGYFVTESSEHFAEYSPWFIKDGPRGPDRALQHPARRVPAPLRGADRRLGRAARRARGGRLDRASSARHEYGADIIRACETGEPFDVQRQRPEPATATAC